MEADQPLMGPGRWAMRLRLASTARLPLLGTERSTTVSLLLLDVRHRGGALAQSHRVCDAWMNSSSRVVPHIPEAFVRGLHPRQSRAQVRRAEHGWSYTADLGVEAIGYDPVAAQGTFPGDATHRAVRDSDGDGEPGATIELRVPVAGRVRIFIVQRSHLVLQGRQTAPGRVEGRVEIRQMEQRTLGAVPGLFGRTPRIRPDAERSDFTLVRVDDGTTCDQLERDSAGPLFAGPAPYSSPTLARISRVRLFRS